MSPTINRSRLAATLLVAALTSFLIAPGAQAQGQSSGGTVVICEATGNPNAPYVEVDVPQSDIGNYGAAEGDIIPAPPNGCPGRAAGTTGPSTPPHRKPAKHRVAQKPTTSPTALSPLPPQTVRPAVAAAPVEQPTPVSTPAIQALPKTGGHTPITIVLGLLLLYCGGVLRWAASGARPQPGTPADRPRL